jgi:flagellar hook-associated protein 3 FlgL
MRISTSSIYDENVNTMNQTQGRIAQTQQQVASGRRILTPADDPAAAARTVELTQSDSMNSQYVNNRNAAKNNLSLTEGILQSVTTLLQDAKTITVNAQAGVLSQSDRKSLATDLQSRYDELFALANSTDGAGNYLFSGSQSSIEPFASTAGGVRYFGDDVPRMVQVSASRQMSTSDSGADIFMRVRSGNGTFVAAPSAGGLPLSNNASIEAGSPGSQVTVASTQNLVVGMPISGGGFPTGTTVASIVNGTSFTTSAPAANVPATGQVIRFGAANTGNSVISPGMVLNPALYSGNNYQVSFSVVGDKATYSVTDVTVPNAPVAVAGQSNVPFVSGQSISFNGIQFDIKGTPDNGDVFTISPSGNQSIFQTLSSIISTLSTSVATGNVTSIAEYGQGISDGLGNIDQALNNILSVRATMGGRLREIDALQTTGDELALQYKQTISQLQDTDYNKAISDLSQQQMTLQAAQKSFLAVSKMSMFNYM